VNGSLIASDSAPASLSGSSFYKTITFDLTLLTGDSFYIAGQANVGVDINYELVYASGSGFTLLSSTAELIEAGIGDTVDMNVNLIRKQGHCLKQLNFHSYKSQIHSQYFPGMFHIISL